MVAWSDQVHHVSTRGPEAVIRLEITGPGLLAGNLPLISRLFLFLSGQIAVKPAEAVIAAQSEDIDSEIERSPLTEQLRAGQRC